MDRIAENKAIIRRLFEDCINAGKLELADELIGDGFVTLNGRGPAAFKSFTSQFGAAFAGAHYTIEQLVAEGDCVTARWTLRATHRGTWFGISATGRAVENRAIGIYRIADGRIVENWLMMDRLNILQQLGAAPAIAANLPAPPQPGDLSFYPHHRVIEDAETGRFG